MVSSGAGRIGKKSRCLDPPPLSDCSFLHYNYKFDWLRPTLEEIVAAYMKLCDQESHDSDDESSGTEGSEGTEEEMGEEDGGEGDEKDLHECVSINDTCVWLECASVVTRQYGLCGLFAFVFSVALSQAVASLSRYQARVGRSISALLWGGLNIPVRARAVQKLETVPEHAQSCVTVIP